MAERRLQGPATGARRDALFAPAYGNVGSSIFYALGLFGLALGVTPLVFVITGIFFFGTAATYAQATAMSSQASGSSIVLAERPCRVNIEREPVL